MRKGVTQSLPRPLPDIMGSDRCGKYLTGVVVDVSMRCVVSPIEFVDDMERLHRCGNSGDVDGHRCVLKWQGLSWCGIIPNKLEGTKLSEHAFRIKLDGMIEECWENGRERMQRDSSTGNENGIGLARKENGKSRHKICQRFPISFVFPLYWPMQHWARPLADRVYQDTREQIGFVCLYQV